MIIRRFISTELLRGWITVIVVLASLFGLLALLDESESLSERYSFTDALRYVAYTTPQRVLELSPVIAALGTILAFAKMTRNSELIIIRAAGFSMRSLLLMCAGPTILMVIFLGIAQVFFVASMHQEAETQKTVLRSGNLDLLKGKGLWSSSENRFFNVRNLRVGQIPEKISLYQFDPGGNLRVAIDADHAALADGRDWTLKDVVYKEWVDGKVTTTHLPELKLGPFWSARELPVLGQSLASMSPDALYEYAEYLEETGQPAGKVRMVFWQKVALPFSAAAMVLLAAVIGVGFGTTRSAAFGWRVFAGSVIGVGFYLLTQIFHTGGQLLGLRESVVVLVPILLAIVLSSIVATITRRPR